MLCTSASVAINLIWYAHNKVIAMGYGYCVVIEIFATTVLGCFFVFISEWCTVSCKLAILKQV